MHTKIEYKDVHLNFASTCKSMIRNESYFLWRAFFAIRDKMKKETILISSGILRCWQLKQYIYIMNEIKKNNNIWTNKSKIGNKLRGIFQAGNYFFFLLVYKVEELDTTGS